MRKILTFALTCITALALTFSVWSAGLELGMSHDILTNEGDVWGTLAVGTEDIHSFELTVGTEDTWDWAERWLYADAEYYLGYVQSGSSIAGLTFGGGVDFKPYVDWSLGVDYDWFGLYVKGEVFDLLPDIYPEIDMFGKFSVDAGALTFGIGGEVGASILFPW